MAPTDFSHQQCEFPTLRQNPRRRVPRRITARSYARSIITGTMSEIDDTDKIFFNCIKYQITPYDRLS